MPKVLSGADMVKALTWLNFAKVGQKGSHVKMRNESTGRTVIVPMHDEIKRGTLKSILEQAGVSREDVDAVLG